MSDDIFAYAARAEADVTQRNGRVGMRQPIAIRLQPQWIGKLNATHEIGRDGYRMATETVFCAYFTRKSFPNERVASLSPASNRD